jgi:hypothetical protein
MPEAHRVRFRPYDLVIAMGGNKWAPKVLTYLIIRDSDYFSPNSTVVVVRWDVRGWAVHDFRYHFALNRQWLVDNTITHLRADESVL